MVQSLFEKIPCPKIEREATITYLSETMQDFNDSINELEKEIRKSKKELDIILNKTK